MDSVPHIHLDEISPEDTARLARGCKRLYLKIMAIWQRITTSCKRSRSLSFLWR